MIFKDRVTLETKEDGASEWTTVGVFPAEVRPLGSDEQISAGRDAVSTRYRVLISKRAPLAALSRDVRVLWRDYAGTYSLVMDGGVEAHTRNRRLVMFSFITKSVLG